MLAASTVLGNLRRVRKGAAAGPRGYTAEFCRLALDDESTRSSFVRAGSALAQARLPPCMAAAFGLGRMVALQKPNGRVRGIVVGDFLRRLVARSLAQSFATRFLDACQPFQFALSTRAGTEAVAHALLVATESRPDATILSVDHVGAFDTISRQAMLQALSSTPGANVCLPFVRQFYSDPSRFVWHDADGQAHLISQAESGEQGDPLMPALFALGQHAALAEMRRHLRPDECLAYLDDIYVITSPERTRVVFDLLSLHLHRHAHIQLHRGKTRVWNASGLEPPGIRELGSVTDPVWVGDRGLPSDQQGLVAPRPKPLCFPRLGLSAAALSAVCRPAPSSPSLLTTCVPFCCGVCASPCPCPRAAAGAVALSTLLATIEQPALGLVLCGVGDARSSERQLVFAGRRGPVSLVTHLCAI